MEKFVEKDENHSLERNRSSYLNAPIRKIWESDWTLLIPETHKESGNIFWYYAVILCSNNIINLL